MKHLRGKPLYGWWRHIGRCGAIASIVAAALAWVHVAHATIPDANGVFHACYTKSMSAIRIIDSATTQCTSNETEIHWSETGPQGAPGPQGPMGSAGPRGPSNGFVGDNFSAGFVPVAVSTDANVPTRILALALPAGSYILNAAVGLHADVALGTLVPFANVECAFSVSGGSFGTGFRTLVGGSTSSSASIPLVAVVTLATADTVVLACIAENGPQVFTRPSIITAVQVAALTGP
jgi:hypothetical protein